MSNESFKSVFWGYKPQAVHDEINRLKAEHEEKVQELRQQIEELTAKRDALLKEKNSLESMLALPELSSRFLEMAQNRIERTETLLKNAAEKDKSSIQQEYNTRQIANDLKKKQIEESIKQCREQFQAMMNNLTRMVEMPLKNADKHLRPNLVVVEPVRDNTDLLAEETEAAGNLEEADLSPEALRYQYLCGKIAGQDLILADGRVIIHKGETITMDVVKTAQANDKLTELVKYMEAPKSATV